jgi:hypothetical protein
MVKEKAKEAVEYVQRVDPYALGKFGVVKDDPKIGDTFDHFTRRG